MQEEKRRQLEEKEVRKMEMVKTLNRIDSAKKEEWNKIHKDTTNYQQTQELLARQ